MARNKTFLYGKNSVYERLRVNPKSIKGVYVQDNFNGPHIIQLLKANGIPYRVVREKELSRIKHADRLQGIVAEVPGFEYTPLEAIVNPDNPVRPCILFLDDINDPHNLGSILRITACLGGFAVVIPAHSSCQVNDTVIHVASGGENFTPVAVVSNLFNAITKAKSAGYWMAAAVVEGGHDITNFTFPVPFALVLGSEGKGIKQAILKHIDLLITLNMKGEPLSLNVAMASAIFCHEISKQAAGSK
ncbi:MAG: RNA methyltransferase [Candidatus Omnitrophica bacterium]|jgi:23S rRNA (guanosine2251-2'-O)-methyltransferase|nr:RNA methyltransferase [Candidatus Omnitrophota bacterium]